MGRFCRSLSAMFALFCMEITSKISLPLEGMLPFTLPFELIVKNQPLSSYLTERIDTCSLPPMCSYSTMNWATSRPANVKVEKDYKRLHNTAVSACTQL